MASVLFGKSVFSICYCIQIKNSLNKLNTIKHFTVVHQHGIINEQFKFKRSSICAKNCHRNPLLIRLCSNGADDAKSSEGPLPNLMEFPQVVWPSFLLTVKNLFLGKFIIQSYFDNEFTPNGFIEGARQALLFVSSHLSKGTFGDLEGTVSPEALQEIEKNYSKFSDAERSSLLVNKEDIYFCFPYQVGIIMNDGSHKRYAEIMVVFHCLRGAQNMPDARNLPQRMPLADYQKKITVCNYRFIKEFTKGVKSQWIVNRLNHFRQ